MRRPLPRRRSSLPPLARVVALLGCSLLVAVASCSETPVSPDGSGPDGSGPRPDGALPDGTPPDGTPPDPAGPDGGDGGEPLGPFPEGFLWGSASASFQAEGGNPNSDWSQFAE